MEQALTFALGVIIGLILAALCKSGKVSCLEGHLAERDAYIKTLEERCTKLGRSNAALGGYIYKRTWRTA